MGFINFFIFKNACNTFYLFYPSTPSPYMMFHLASSYFKAMILKGSFSHLLQLQMLNCFNGINLVSKYFGIFALRNQFPHSDCHMTNSFPQQLSNGVSEWTWPSISVWVIYLPPFTYSWPMYLHSYKDWGDTKQHLWKQSIWWRAGTSKTQLCMETKSEEWGKIMLIRKWIISVLLPFTIPDCVRCRTILRGHF